VGEICLEGNARYIMITSRIDEVTGIPLRYRQAYLPAPISCKIELSAECNLNCRYCVRTVRESSGMMDRAFYSRLIRELKDAGVKEVGLFFIGESFLVKWLPEAIAEARDVGIEYIFLTTNGSAATPARIKQCMEAGLDSLKFSMNFYSAAQLADVAQVDGKYWMKAIDNLKAARRIRDEGGYKCKLYASSIELFGNQAEAMQDLVREISPYVDEHYWLPLFGMQGASRTAGMKPTPGNPGRSGKMRDPLPCWSVHTEAHVTVDGKLAACCFGSGIDGDLIMADLKEVSFKQGWNSPAFQELRKAHLAKDVSGTACANCIAA
jgi:organic radical activating enzyme